jgi:hypothetical protein
MNREIKTNLYAINDNINLVIYLIILLIITIVLLTFFLSYLEIKHRDVEKFLLFQLLNNNDNFKYSVFIPKKIINSINNLKKENGLNKKSLSIITNFYRFSKDEYDLFYNLIIKDN